MRAWILSAVVLAALGGGLSRAADDDDDAPAGNDVAPAGDEAPAGFKEVYGEWKTTIARLDELKTKYKTAKKADRLAIEKEYEALVERMKELTPQLKEVQLEAEKAFETNPEDAEAAEYLASTASGHFAEDNYEEAARLATLLIDNKFSNKAIYELAGIAAFRTSDFDAAEKYLKTAMDQKVIREQGSEYLRDIGKYRKYWAAEKKIRAAEAKADDLPRVLLKTNKGEITIELFENEAPNAVANFVSLVEKGFYNGVTFHRVLPGFMAQGGDPDGTGSGGPGYTIACECHQDNFRRHFRGTLSMAHAGRDTGGSQFFLTFHPTGHLDGMHTAFGRVIEGMDVLSKLQRRDPGDPSAPEPDKIVEDTVVRKRAHDYQPVTKPD